MIVAKTNRELYFELLMALLVVVMAVAVSANAQEEPTPAPEPAQEEPTPVPEPPVEEPAVAAEPEAPATAAEPEEPAAAAEPAVVKPAEEAEPPVAAIPINYRQKTLITIGGKKAQANGVVEFVVQPQGGDPVKVRVNVLAKSKPKAITSDVLKELDFAIDERYKVNRTGDQKIIVKTLKKNPPIAVTVKTQSLSGVSVTVGNG